MIKLRKEYKSMRMLIVEDEKDLCNILKKRLQKDYTIDVCMDGEIAKDYLNTYTYDIILLDINLTNISKENGLEIAEELIQSTPNLKVVMLTGYVKSIYEERAKTIGAYGFVDKNIDPKQLISILKKVDSGKKYFEQIESQDYVEALTDREIVILNLSKKGLSVKDIEETLQISRRTVFNHLNHIYSKLLVNNKQEAIYKAEQLGYFMDF